MHKREQDIERWLGQVLGDAYSTRCTASDDASFRRYFRIQLRDGGQRILMDAPTQFEDCRPFVDIARRLSRAGLNVPQVLAQDLVLHLGL